ncbi:hypothetical protein [Brucella intermedia]|uniref:Phage ABA sandwich domain-containing protein n=1 Tax=Brucella intermedia M86 TaxID=1234597 RepID=M5JUH8_9HYPH|nr:hypothetical protein [Brucella intermedia]ELT48109.1 hypothetical protein D584_16550 [Brucella intermedia M86]
MTSDLITRLSKLDAPDRGMDAEIEVAVRRIEAARSGLAEEYWANWQASPDGTVYDPHTRYSSQPFTASVDAAIALAERVLPNERVWINRIAFDSNHQWRASLTGNHVSWGVNPAIALLIALLRAKEASKL